MDGARRPERLPGRRRSADHLPDRSTEQPTGPGAIVWAAGRSCPGGPGARLDEISPAGTPRPPLGPHGRGHHGRPRSPIPAAAAPHGLIALAGTDPAARTRDLLIQGAADGPFAPLHGARSARPLALANGYLATWASSPRALPRTRSSVELERFYAHRAQPRGVINGPGCRAPGGGGPRARLPQRRARRVGGRRPALRARSARLRAPPCPPAAGPAGADRRSRPC